MAESKESQFRPEDANDGKIEDEKNFPQMKRTILALIPELLGAEKHNHYFSVEESDGKPVTKKQGGDTCDVVYVVDVYDEVSGNTIPERKVMKRGCNLEYAEELQRGIRLVQDWLFTTESGHSKKP